MALPGMTWGSGHELDIEAPWLSVDIYDSDFAAVRYEPPGPGSGTAYLGNTPRTYFDAESASAPADMPREAEGVACWIGQQGRVVSAELRELIASFLASDSRAERPWAGAELDDADIFVEIKLSLFPGGWISTSAGPAQAIAAAAANALLPLIGLATRSLAGLCEAGLREGGAGYPDRRRAQV
jgi:hypothetical protein